MKKTIIALALTSLLFSCKKETLKEETVLKKEKYYFYLEEVNKDGNVSRTPVVEVL
jgi:hypothetical protein